MLVKGKNVSQWFTSAGWIFETSDDRQGVEVFGGDQTCEGRDDQEDVEREVENIYFLRPRRTTLYHRLRVTGSGSNRGDSWDGVSGEAFLDFLTRCLEIDPRKRMGTRAAIAHRFVAAST